MMKSTSLLLAALVGHTSTAQPTSAPTTWDNGLTFNEKATEWGNRLKTEFRLIRSGTCETALTADGTADTEGVCKRFIGGEYYAFGTEFAGGVLSLNTDSAENADTDWGDGTGELTPIAGGNFDMSTYSFRMSTLTTEPAGLSLDIVNKYVVFNNVPVDDAVNTYSADYGSCGNPGNAGDYNDKMMCVCECVGVTSSPTSSPTVADGVSLECAESPLPGRYNNEESGAAAIDIGVSFYDESSNDITLQPWINWNSDQLFHNLEKSGASELYGEPFKSFVYQASVDDHGACVWLDTAASSGTGLVYPAYCRQSDANGASSTAGSTGLASGTTPSAYIPDVPKFGLKYDGNADGYYPDGTTDAITGEIFDSPRCNCLGADSRTITADGSNLPSVSGWVDFLPVKSYPYEGADGSPTDVLCRFDMDENGQFPSRLLEGTTATLDGADKCFTIAATTVANPDGTTRAATKYTFYLATTLCYTNAAEAECEAATYGDVTNQGTFQTNAYVYPESFHVSKKLAVAMADGSTDLAQCRRTWQLVDLDVNLGGFLDMVPTVSFATQLAVEQDDATITVPEQDNEWQIYRDEANGFNLTSSNYVVTKFGPNDDIDAVFPPLTVTNGVGSDLFVFDKFYQIEFVLESSTMLAGYPISYWLDQQYNDLLVTYQWQRLNEADLVWRDLTDRYSIESTAVTAEATNALGNVQYLNTNNEGGIAVSLTKAVNTDVWNERFEIITKFNKRSQLFVEDAIRLLVQLEYGGAINAGFESVDMQQSGITPTDTCEEFDNGFGPCSSGLSETECRKHAEDIGNSNFQLWLSDPNDSGGQGNPASAPGSQCFRFLGTGGAIVYMRGAYQVCLGGPTHLQAQIDHPSSSDAGHIFTEPCICQCPTGGATRRLLELDVPMGKTEGLRGATSDALELSNLNAISRELSTHTEGPTATPVDLSHTHDYDTLQMGLYEVAVIKDILESPTRLDVHQAQLPHVVTAQHQTDSDTNNTLLIVVVGFGVAALAVGGFLMSSKARRDAAYSGRLLKDVIGVDSNHASEVIGFLANSA